MYRCALCLLAYIAASYESVTVRALHCTDSHECNVCDSEATFVITE